MATSPGSERTQAPLTSSSEERPAKHSASQDSEEGSGMNGATSHLSIADLLIAFGRVGSSGKTSPVSCHRTEDGILAPSSGRWLNSGMGGPIESLTLSSSEFHSGAVESSLSDILETGDVPQRYFLSPKACAGILRRAEKRGKRLPEALDAALRSVSRLPEPSEEEAGPEDGPATQIG